MNTTKIQKIVNRLDAVVHDAEVKIAECSKETKPELIKDYQALRAAQEVLLTLKKLGEKNLTKVFKDAKINVGNF